MATAKLADVKMVLSVVYAELRSRSRRKGTLEALRIHNDRGAFEARTRVTYKVAEGTVWARDGWRGVNGLTSSVPAIPDEPCGLFPFTCARVV